MAKDWVTVEVSLDPLLQPIEPVIESIDSVLSFLISILNIVQTILNVIKAFLVGFLDPLRSLVELILEEIRNLIQDLRQLGVYITGDWKLIDPDTKHSFLLGGYQAYERRMMARLLDTSDPNRPNFTSSTTVLGAFFYTSSGDITEIIRVIRALLRFFGQENLMASGMPYGTPTTPEIKYGTEGAGIGAFRNLSQASQSAVPDRVGVSWSMPAGSGGIPTAFGPAPKGFLIHVSTIQDGFNVLSLTPNSTGSAQIQDLPRITAAAVDPLTNGALKLYGGVTDIRTDASDFVDVDPVEDTESPHKAALVLQQDPNTPLIKLSTLLPTGGGDVPLIANTYFVSTSFLAKLGPGTSFTAVFNRSDLPQHASFVAGSDGFAEVDGDPVDPTTYYFRVRAVTEDYVGRFDDALTATLSAPANVYPTGVRPYFFARDSLLEAVNGVLLPLAPSEEDPSIGYVSMTPASGPGVAEFPSAIQTEYIKLVQVAMAVAILVRADLTEGVTEDFRNNTYTNGQGTGLEGAARDLMARYGISPTWFRGNRPQRFRLKLKNALLRIASDLQQRAGPPESVAESIVAAGQGLLTFRWSDLNDDYPGLTILESVGIVNSETPTVYRDETKGVGGNPFCRSLPKETLELLYRTQGGPSRTSYFDVKPADSAEVAGKWNMGNGSGDMSPIIYSDYISEIDPNTGAVASRFGQSFSGDFIRVALLEHLSFLTLSGREDEAVLTQAATVLQLAAASVSRPAGDTQWIAIRLLPNALPEIDELLERLDRFMQGVLDGLEGITDKIVAYIEAVQARIYQLQALLQQIQALLRSLDLIRLPSVSGLVLVESGTGGIVQGLIESGNKPSDSELSYGSGVLVVSGGIPTVLLETLQLILGGE